MHVSLTTWIITGLVILGLFVFDFFAHVRTPHEPSLRESGFWSAVYIAIAIAFGGFVWWQWGGVYGGEYFAGYVTEKALSVDNLFVFVVIMAKFAVPKIYQQKVLLLGIVMALVMRGAFIAVGAAAINTYSWVFYLFGLFLLLTAVKLFLDYRKDEHDDEAPDNALMRLVKRRVPSTPDFHGTRLTVLQNGRRL
ncbi:MAG: TerC family protein, partial [Gordonia sp. (in: high G+C Gram-positive bacteria)]|nr:TerC family protein [Gordonia sp. (in: high G+C Gram-positive bacteria)]